MHKAAGISREQILDRAAGIRELPEDTLGFPIIGRPSTISSLMADDNNDGRAIGTWNHHVRSLYQCNAFAKFKSGLIACLLMLGGICVPSAEASHPPLTDVEVWSDGGDLYFKVFDPKRSAWIESSVAGTYALVQCVDGVVAWANVGAVGFAVYDPERASWRTGSWSVPYSDAQFMRLSNNCGVVAWRCHDEFIPIVRLVMCSRYNPVSGSWEIRQLEECNVHLTDGTALVNQDGIVLWDHFFASEVHYTIYDPSRGLWREGYETFSGSSISLNISDSAVSWTADGETSTRGYDYTTGLWYDGATKPLAYFHCGPVVGASPLWVWFTDMSIGATSWNWSFGDGTGSSGSRSTWHVYTNADGTHYVDVNGANPVPPYTSWPTASTSIQNAIDSCPPFAVISSVSSPNGSDTYTRSIGNTGSDVLVADGRYSLSQQISIAKNIALHSVNGASNTTIDGNRLTRCISMNDANAVVDGFSIMNGFTSVDGAGVLSLSGGVLRNCHVYGNVLSNADIMVRSQGGGVYFRGGTVEDCVIYSNSTTSVNGGGGVYLDESGTVTGCEVFGNTSVGSGGGARASGGTVEDCSVHHNSAGWGAGVSVGDGSTFLRCRVFKNDPGGVWLSSGGALQDCLIYSNTEEGVTQMGSSTMQNCLIYSNTAAGITLRSSSATVENCTITGNGAGVTLDPGVFAMDVFRNVILYGNFTGSNRMEYICPTDSVFACDFSCVSPVPTNGTDNVSGEPLFVDASHADFRLQAMSSCIDEGTNLDWSSAGLDIVGSNRVVGGDVDIGAYESPYAAIDASAGQWGTISPSGHVGVLVGGSQTFTITVDNRHAVADGVRVDGFEEGITNSWTFLNVTNRHEIEAHFLDYPDQDGLAMYTDLQAGTNGHAVSWIATNGWSYCLQRTGSLTPVVWSNVCSLTNGLDTGMFVVTNWFGTNLSGFYRLLATPVR